MTQLVFEKLSRQVDRATLAAALGYLKRHRDTYLTYAMDIEPDLSDWRAVRSRFAFAILSANTTVDMAAKAHREILRAPAGAAPLIQYPGIVHDKIRCVNALPFDSCLGLLKRDHESWDRYRLRIRDNVLGLEITKASYAACLLYPRMAEVACLDVWMQKFFTHGVNSSPKIRWYRSMERKIRRDFAVPARVSVSLAQWAIWDYARGTGPSRQNFF